jgi:hypothetical protein
VDVDGAAVMFTVNSLAVYLFEHRADPYERGPLPEPV